MRVRSFLASAAGAATWLLIVGCYVGGCTDGAGGAGGTGGTGGADGAVSVSPEQALIDGFCDAILPPMCESLHSCCLIEKPLTNLNAGSTPEECVQRWKASWCLHDNAGPPLAASLKDGHTILDQSKVDDCVAQLKAMSSGGAACLMPAAYYVFHSCFGAFRGQITGGEACDWAPNAENFSFMQCKDGLCQRGKCVPFLKSGDACSNSLTPADPPDQICNYVEGEWCHGAKDTGTCGLLRKVGEACQGGYPEEYECMSQNCPGDHCAPVSPTFSSCILD